MSLTIDMDETPPSINQIYKRLFIKGRVITCMTTEGKEFKKSLSETILEAEHPIMQGSTKVTMQLTFPDNKRRDVDNYSKALLDCMTGTIMRDDSQITEIHITKRIIKGQSHTKIIIEEQPKEN